MKKIKYIFLLFIAFSFPAQSEILINDFPKVIPFNIDKMSEQLKIIPAYALFEDIEGKKIFLDIEISGVINGVKTPVIKRSTWDEFIKNEYFSLADPEYAVMLVGEWDADFFAYYVKGGEETKFSTKIDIKEAGAEINNKYITRKFFEDNDLPYPE